MSTNIGYVPAWPFSNFNSHRKLWTIRQAIIVPPVGFLCKFFLDYMCRTKVIHRQRLYDVIENREEGRGLITVCNHHSCLDDPLLNGVLRWRHLLWQFDKLRWSPAAHNILFTNCFYSWYFSTGKGVPIVRGHGVYQRPMDFLVERLSLGEWVHIFPEGKVNIHPSGDGDESKRPETVLPDTNHARCLLPLRWGVGRLLCEPPVTPVLLPFYHCGMDSVLPNRRPHLPRFAKKVTIMFGHAMSLDSAVEQLRRSGATAQHARATVTERVRLALDELRISAEPLHAHRLSDKSSTDNDR